jgi:dinuclear metal center YbgI/SA1388 family protein
MKCSKIIEYFEQWAPAANAWERDNVGLQVGNENSRVKNILLSLDLNNKVVDEAIKRNCNLIITHHPFLFHSIKTINTTRDSRSIIIEKLLKKDVNVFSAHTNLDFTKDGVSFQLAKAIGLTNIHFLKNLEDDQHKLVVFVPNQNVEKVAEAIHNAGGGVIGEYSNCGFRINGMGTFKGSVNSNPSVGKKNKLEKVDETRLEVLVSKNNLSKVISSMTIAHPYEEIAYDVYPLKNQNVNFGFGAVGEFEKGINVQPFFKALSKNLKLKNFRYTSGKNNTIKKVAVCGGSCSELVDAAIASGADAFITADLKYHTFQDAEGKILLVDAGHYETEVPVLNEIKKRLEKILNNNKSIKVFKYSGSTNPVLFYNN